MTELDLDAHSEPSTLDSHLLRSLMPDWRIDLDEAELLLDEAELAEAELEDLPITVELEEVVPKEQLDSEVPIALEFVQHVDPLLMLKLLTVAAVAWRELS